MDGERNLVGGRMGGALLVDGSVRRPVRPWSSGVRALLTRLDNVGFEGCPTSPDGRSSQPLAWRCWSWVACWRAWRRSVAVLAEAVIGWRPTRSHPHGPGIGSWR